MNNVDATARAVRALRGLRILPGWHRIANKLAWRPAQFVVENNGLTFEGDLKSFIDRELFLFGGYEEDRIAAFLSLIPSDRRCVALDVGANVGTHALRFAQSFGEVHAFEPNPHIFRQLQRNISLNDLRVIPHNMGLADLDGDLDFHLTENLNLGLGTFSKIEQYDLPLRLVGQVGVVRADSYLPGKIAGRIDAVKIDTQGFEPEVLRGMRSLLLEHRPYIWFEVGSATMEQLGSRAALERMIPFPFRLLRFEKAGLRKETLSPAREIGTGDYVAAPKSSL